MKAMDTVFKILICDDDLLILHVYSKLLTMQGYEVAISKNAIDIVALAAAHTPDLIIIDHNMPFVSGMQAIMQLKAHETYKNVPLIYCSTDIDLAVLAKESGADGYISKSAKPEHLYALIESILKK